MRVHLNVRIWKSQSVHPIALVPFGRKKRHIEMKYVIKYFALIVYVHALEVIIWEIIFKQY